MMMTTPYEKRPILLIENNLMDIDFALLAFKENHITRPVVICRDGEEALAYIAAHACVDDPNLPVLVLLDLRLPKIDGLEILRQAKQDPIWQQIPFVILTSSQEPQDIAMAYSLGINSYVVKPVDFTVFVRVIRRIYSYWLLVNEPVFSEPTRR
jgi:CheY-like chemotaxis protein